MTTVLGVFADSRAANEVARELASNGFSRDRVRVSDSMLRESASGGAGLTGQEESHQGGGIAGWFRSLFGGDDASDDTSSEHRHYTEAVRRGSCVVAVEANDEEADRAAEIMNRNGAIDIKEEASKNRELPREAAGSERRMDNREMGDRAIPVVQEELRVGKRVISRGAVRIISTVVNTPVEEEVTLREERVRVDRKPADRPISAGDEANLKDQTIEVTETAEEPVVSKQSRVVEEIIVGKETTERTERVRDNVRRTEVRVERADDDRAVDDDRVTEQDPGYRYGYAMASDTRYRGRRWEDVESDLRSGYERDYPGNAWDRVKTSVRRGWDKVTGRG